jgi:hypothetical protein
MIAARLISRVRACTHLSDRVGEFNPRRVRACTHLADRVKYGACKHAPYGLIPVVLIAIMFSMTAAPATMAAEPMPSLDNILTEAMNNNPHIIAAKAQVALDEAKLNSARMEVARQIVELHGQLTVAQDALANAEQQLDRMNKLGQANAVSMQEMGNVRLAVTTAKAKVDAINNELRYQSGKAGPLTSRTATAIQGTVTTYALSSSSSQAASREQPKGPVIEKLFAAMDKKTEINFKDIPLAELMKFLQSSMEVGIMFDPSAVNYSPADPSTPITLEFKPAIPYGAVLQALEDKTELRFVVRDYGLLLTSKEMALDRNYTYAIDLWKTANTTKAATSSGGSSSGSSQGRKLDDIMTKKSAPVITPTLPPISPAQLPVPTKRTNDPAGVEPQGRGRGKAVPTGDSSLTPPIMPPEQQPDIQPDAPAKPITSFPTSSTEFNPENMKYWAWNTNW